MPTLQGRRLRRSDLEQTVEWDARYVDPYDAEGWVMTLDGAVRGYMLSQVCGSVTAIGHVCVHPDARRQGIGSTLVTMVRETCKRGVRALVDEKDLTAQLFFKHCGLKCVDILEDQYVFFYERR